MANISAIANAVRSAMCDAMVDSLDAGSGAGKVKIYTTAKGTLLATITLNDPAFGAASNGVATVDSDPTISGTAVAGGVAAVAEFTDSDDNIKFEGTVTATGGGGALTLASTTIANGGTVTIGGGTITIPAA
jgi:hypothetical protein